MSFEFPEIAGLQEYRNKADIIEDLRHTLAQTFGDDSSSEKQHLLFRYLNEMKYDYPWLSWRIRMSQGKINVVLYFDGLPNVRKPIQDIKVKEGVL